MRLIIPFLLCVSAWAQNNQQALLIARPQSAGGGAATFTKIQGNIGTNVSVGTTFSVVLPSNPTAGNAVLCSIGLFPNALTLTSVVDGNSNAYTTSASSPSTTQTSATGAWIVYLLNAPANADKTITVTASSTITFFSGIRCSEFHKSSGVPAVDTDAAGNGAASATINTPSITAGAAGYLLYFGTYTGAGSTSVNSPWTAADGFSAGGFYADGYILSASGSAQAVAVTQMGAAAWNSMAISIK